MQGLAQLGCQLYSHTEAEIPLKGSSVETRLSSRKSRPLANPKINLNLDIPLTYIEQYITMAIVPSVL
jgi:hypothetical protein